VAEVDATLDAVGELAETLALVVGHAKDCFVEELPGERLEGKFEGERKGRKTYVNRKLSRRRVLTDLDVVVELEAAEFRRVMSLPVCHPSLQVVDDGSKLRRLVAGVHRGRRAGASERVDRGGTGTDRGGGRSTGEGELGGGRGHVAGRVEERRAVDVREIEWWRVARRHFDADHAGEVLLFLVVGPLDRRVLRPYRHDRLDDVMRDSAFVAGPADPTRTAADRAAGTQERSDAPSVRIRACGEGAAGAVTARSVVGRWRSLETGMGRRELDEVVVLRAVSRRFVEEVAASTASHLERGCRRTGRGSRSTAELGEFCNAKEMSEFERGKRGGNVLLLPFFGLSPGSPIFISLRQTPHSPRLPLCFIRARRTSP
jgi:hypothetical protein